MVDGIGRGGGLPPAGGPKGPGGPKRPEGAEKTFDVHETGKARDAQATDAVSASTPLDQLKAGTIDFDRYLDLKVDEATSHLQAMPAAQLETVRSMLRERMATDPELVDLVKQATGHAPRTPDE